jgi:hypothetical protein
VRGRVRGALLLVRFDPISGLTPREALETTRLGNLTRAHFSPITDAVVGGESAAVMDINFFNGMRVREFRFQHMNRIFGFGLLGRARHPRVIATGLDAISTFKWDK